MLNMKEDKKAIVLVCVKMSHETSKFLTAVVFIVVSILQKLYLL